MDSLITVSGTDLAKDAILNNYQNAVTTKAAVDALEKATSDLTDTLNASVASVTEADGVVTVTTNGGETSTFEAGDPKSIVSVTTETAGATFTAKDGTSTSVTTNKVRSTFTSSTTFQYHPCMSWEGTQTGELYKCKQFTVYMPTGDLTCGTVNGIDVTTLATKDELNSIDLTDYAKTADLATVATSGSYNDLTNKPTIPAAVTVDSALSSTSTNPVQNKVINTALAGKLSTSGTAARATADAGGNVITSTYAKKSDVYLYVGDEKPTETRENLIYVNPDELEVVNWGDAVKSVNNVVADGSGNVTLDTVPKAQALDTTNTAGMQALVDFFYPVGTVYACTGSKPAFMNYGTWEAFAEGRTLVGAGTGTDENGLKMTFTNGATGGEYKHTLTTGEMPAHTHTRGTMNITGMARIFSEYNKGNTNSVNVYTGCFVWKAEWESDSSRIYGSSINIPSGSYDSCRNVDFDASRTWTGDTSSAGGNSSHNNIAPYRVVRFYRRTS